MATSAGFFTYGPTCGTGKKPRAVTGRYIFDSWWRALDGGQGHKTLDILVFPAKNTHFGKPVIVYCDGKTKNIPAK
ncbi:MULTISPECIES: hypothetical protein [Polaromonas]|uniref:Uncharacterized protein n=1 Tax=Polaromonas aquatica TaxID=332657 RepID=A0ABW1U601_9BURK